MSGDSSAYGEIVTRHEQPLRRVVTAMLRDRHAVEDVLQDVFLIGYRKLADYRGDAPFGAWLYRIAVREAIHARSRLRKLWRRAIPATSLPRQELPERADATASGSTQSVEERDELEHALALLECLPPRPRAAFVLHIVEERPYTEIAEILGCSMGTVGSWIHRARATLREEAKRSQSVASPRGGWLPRGEGETEPIGGEGT